MSRPAEVIWLDALEHLPAKTILIFTTNDPDRLSQRFRNRCQEIEFETRTEVLAPYIRAFVEHVWYQETGQDECPLDKSLGLPSLANWNASFRMALKQMEPHVRRSLQ